MHDTAQHGAATHGSTRISYRVPDAAIQIGVSTRHMYRLIETGQVSTVRISKGVQVITNGELEDFIKRKTAEAAQAA